MKIHINMKMDSKWLTLFILILIIIALCFLNYGHPIIEINHYANCSCPKTYPDYMPYTTYITSINYNHSKSECCYPTECYENIEDIPKDCNCIYPVVCGTYKELVGS